MPRHSPPPVDQGRLRALLASRGDPRDELDGDLDGGPFDDPVSSPVGDPVGDSAEDTFGGPPVGRAARAGRAGPPRPSGTWLPSAPVLPGEQERWRPRPPPPEETDDPLSAPGRHRGPPRVVTVPSALRGARSRVSWRAVVALVVVLCLAVGLFAVRVARAEQAAAPVQVDETAGTPVMRKSVPSAFASAGDQQSGGKAAGSTAAPPGAARTVMVHVVGQVAHPGVVTLPEGARVGDCLTAAGGALPTADLQALNLARVLSDGEQVVVPKPGEAVPAAAAPTGAGASASAGIINLNQADASALDALPGVGPVLAARIVDWRTQHGRFTSVDELGEVSGIGDKLLEQIRPRVRV